MSRDTQEAERLGLPHIQQGVWVREVRVTGSETLCPCMGPGLLGQLACFLPIA